MSQGGLAHPCDGRAWPRKFPEHRLWPTCACASILGAEARHGLGYCISSCLLCSLIPCRRLDCITALVSRLCVLLLPAGTLLWLHVLALHRPVRHAELL